MRAFLAALVLTLLAAACGASTDGALDEAPTVEPVPTATALPAPTMAPEATAEPTATPVPGPVEHRIAIREGARGVEFFDVATGETFVGRGFNHWQWELVGGYLQDRTFRAGENGLEQARADLEEMASYGFNATRIWVTACFDLAVGCLVDDDGELRPEYIDNVAGYLQAAKDNGIQVIFTVDDIIGPGRYDVGKNDECCDFAGFNVHDLTSGGISDQVRFWEDLIGGLIERNAALDAIWAYELRNEQFFESRLPPFSNGATVTTANGETYDVSDPDQARAMRDDGLAHWGRTVGGAIKALDPTALVTVGFFMSAEGPVDLRTNDPRLVDPRPLLEVDEIDFIDFREYPGFAPGGWDSVWANSFLTDADKPVILGEFGAFYSGFDTIDEAVTAYTQWMGEACQAGLVGFLGWVWDNQGIYAETWPAVADGGAIAAAVSPAELPDPCSPPVPATGNLAYNRPTTASLFEDTEEFVAPPSNAVDGSEGSWWTAPDSGPQWIEIDLELDSIVEALRLSTDLGADTPLRVVVDLLDRDRGLLATHELTSDVGSTEGIELSHEFAEPVEGVRLVRATTYREGWIIWHEIEVLGTR